jgi:hypothetical protein
MASVQLDPASKLYRIRFRFAGKGYFRSLGTRSEAEANALCGRAESVINAITQGFVAVPPGTDPGDFILAGGKSIQPSVVIDLPKCITLAALFETYERDLTPGSKEAYTRDTERTHRRNLLGYFGDKFAVTSLDHRSVQEYVNTRSGEGMAVKSLRLGEGDPDDQSSDYNPPNTLRGRGVSVAASRGQHEGRDHDPLHRPPDCEPHLGEPHGRGLDGLDWQK